MHIIRGARAILMNKTTSELHSLPGRRGRQAHVNQLVSDLHTISVSIFDCINMKLDIGSSFHDKSRSSMDLRSNPGEGSLQSDPLLLRGRTTLYLVELSILRAQGRTISCPSRNIRRLRHSYLGDSGDGSHYLLFRPPETPRSLVKSPPHDRRSHSRAVPFLRGRSKPSYYGPRTTGRYEEDI